MIKYCAGTIQNKDFYYLSEGKDGSSIVTQDLEEAILFSKDVVETGFRPLNPFVWLPVFVVNDLIEG